MKERGTIPQQGEAARRVVREFLIYRDIEKPFTEKDRSELQSRFNSLPSEERVETAQLLFGGISTDARPLMRQRASDMVCFLYEEYDIPAKLYLDGLANVSRFNHQENTADMLQLAPRLLATVDNATFFFRNLESFALYHKDNPVLLGVAARLKQSKKQLIRTLSREVFPPKVNAAVVPDFNAELPDLWNTYQMTSSQLAKLFGLPRAWVRKEVGVLRKNGMPLSIRTGIPDYLPLTTRLQMIAGLADKWSPEEISTILNLDRRVVSEQLFGRDPASEAVRFDREAFIAVLPDLWNNQGLSGAEIADRYGLNENYVLQLISRLRCQGYPLERRNQFSRANP